MNIMQEMDDFQALNAEILHAKIVMLANQMAIPAATLREMEINEYRDHVLERMVYQIKSYLLASGEEIVRCNERWPADWLQAVKERWAPRWIKRRWPVRYREHRVERTFYRAMCPHIEIPHHQGNEVHFTFLRDAGGQHEHHDG